MSSHASQVYGGQDWIRPVTGVLQLVANMVVASMVSARWPGWRYSSWRALTVPKVALLLVLVNTLVFVFSAALMSLGEFARWLRREGAELTIRSLAGVGTSLNSAACEASIWMCILWYSAAKVVGHPHASRRGRGQFGEELTTLLSPLPFPFAHLPSPSVPFLSPLFLRLITALHAPLPVVHHLFPRRAGSPGPRTANAAAQEQDLPQQLPAPHRMGRSFLVHRRLSQEQNPTCRRPMLIFYQPLVKPCGGVIRHGHHPLPLAALRCASVPWSVSKSSYRIGAGRSLTPA